MKKQVLAIMMSTTCLSGWTSVAVAQDEGAQNSDTIIVTAQRRAESIKDVPVAVTAVGEEALRERQVQAVVDIVGVVPNVHVSNNIGQGSAVTTFIRGVGDTESIITIDNPVGFYLDDVYLGRTGVNNLFLFDVERIEVLRGPQGTLYGRNTSAGAIKVVANKPDFDAYSGRAEVSYGRFDEWRARGVINAPLGDSAAFRISGLVGGGGGDTLNLATGERVNDAKVAGVKAAFLAEINDQFSVEIVGDWSRTDQDGRHAVGVFGATPPPTESLYVINTQTDMDNVGEAWGVSGVLTYDVNENVTLKSVTAFRNTQQRYNLESSDQPLTLFEVFSDADTDQFSQEIQILGSAFDDRLQYVGGLYYFNERGDSFIGDFIGQFFWLNKDLNVDTDSYAAFAQLDYAITDRLTLIAGGRFTRDEKSVDIEQRLGDVADVGFEPSGVVLFDTDTLDGLVIPARPDDPVRTDLEFSRFTPKAGLEYAINDDWNTYFTWTRGFKSGGWSARVFFDPNEFFDFEPEEIDSFEVGLKGAIGNVGQVNIASFYYDYKNLFNTGTTDTGFGIATSNAEIYGVELESSWRLFEGHTGFFNVSWQDGERNSISQTSIVLGDELQRFASWQIGAGFSGEMPITDGFKAIYNAQYTYQGEHFVDPQNSTFGRNDPINLVNARIGVATEDDRYSLTAGCRNCFGDEYIEQLLNFPAFGFITVYPGERAAWNVTLSASF